MVCLVVDLTKSFPRAPEENFLICGSGFLSPYLSTGHFNLSKLKPMRGAPGLFQKIRSMIKNAGLSGARKDFHSLFLLVEEIMD
jgi:hypothetical protein